MTVIIERSRGGLGLDIMRGWLTKQTVFFEVAGICQDTRQRQQSGVGHSLDTEGRALLRAPTAMGEIGAKAWRSLGSETS